MVHKVKTFTLFRKQALTLGVDIGHRLQNSLAIVDAQQILTEYLLSMFSRYRPISPSLPLHEADAQEAPQT